MGFIVPTQSEIEHRFGAPDDELILLPSDEQPDEYKVSRNLRIAAIHLVSVVPPGRELAMALTKLEEAMMWAIAGIERAHRGGSDE